MKHIKIFDKKYEIVEDNGKWEENCPICDLCEVCASFSLVLKKQLCDTPTGETGYYHFREVKKED